MKFNMYAIQDIKTGFMTPTLDQNDLAAARNFQSAIMQGNGLFGTHPEDFRLFKIATFESDSGVVTPEEPMVLISEGRSVKLEVIK